MSENTTERLLPCSGRTLAEVIHSTARREYDEQRDLIMDRASAVILDILMVREEDWDLVLKADAIFKRTTKSADTSLNIHQSFKQVRNSALMPVSSWKERLDLKLDEFFKNISFIRNSELAQFDTRVADIFMNIEKSSHLMNESKLSEIIYQSLEHLRREKSAISTRMSRIRKVAEYVLEPDSRSARELGEMEIKTPNDASIWLTKVAESFIKHKESSSKFAASYERPWQDHGHMVIERNEKVTRQNYWRNSLRNVHLIEKMLASSLEEDRWNSPDFTFNTVSERTNYRLNNQARKSDDISQSMMVEIKTGGDRFESYFSFPDFVAGDLPEFQITLLEFLHKKYPEIEMSISTHFSPRPTIMLSMSKVAIQDFTQIYRAASDVLVVELRKRNKSN